MLLCGNGSFWANLKGFLCLGGWKARTDDMGKLPLKTEEVLKAIPWELATFPEKTSDRKPVALVEMNDERPDPHIIWVICGINRELH